MLYFIISFSGLLVFFWISCFQSWAWDIGSCKTLQRDFYCAMQKYLHFLFLKIISFLKLKYKYLTSSLHISVSKPYYVSLFPFPIPSMSPTAQMDVFLSLVLLQTCTHTCMHIQMHKCINTTCWVCLVWFLLVIFHG